MQPAVEARRSRVRALAGLGAAVLLGHLWLADGALPSRLGAGDAQSAIKRFEVTFVHELQPAAPPAAPPLRQTAPRRPVTAVAVAPAASAAASAAEPAVLAGRQADVLPPPAEDAQSAPAAQSAASAPDTATTPTLAQAPAAGASDAAGRTFEWPPSTRLSYTLGGNYRGPVEGRAQVEWLRSGSRYQVTVEASVGPAFAPLMTRRVSSEGEVTADGLSPRRYEEETRVVMREPRRVSIVLDPDRIRLANGREAARPPGVQDSASQFVHLTWLFTTQPQWLVPGRSIELPLALPRHVLPWTYDVLDTETLHTPVGPLQAVHVKPRRPPADDGRAAGHLTAEMWVAPTLQYLPVRIIIRQDEQTFIDMLIERLPQQQ